MQDQDTPQASQPDAAPEFSRPFRVADLTANTERHFRESAGAHERAALAQLFSATAIHQLRFAGDVKPFQKRGWQVSGVVTAKVEQACVISLQPVLTKVNQEVRRCFVPDLEDKIDLDFASLLEDRPEDDFEPLEEVIDLGLIATETVALALPTFPRAQNAVLEHNSAAPQGVAPITDEDTKPFAGLAALRDKLAEKDQ